MDIKEKLKKYNQEHLLKFEYELTNTEKKNLYNQIESLDFSYIDHLNDPQTLQEDIIEPIKALNIDEINANKEQFKKIGIEALKKYEVGALLLAGGMGTRLGSNNPKGMFNIGKTRDVFIFQRIFENTLEVVKECGVMIPFFIMTSENNHEQTVSFLEEHNFFGYDKNFVKFFIQETAPCVDLNGKILLENKGKVATSPNGNGGWFNSLLNNAEAKAMLEKFNIKWLNIFAVDNVQQKIADPVFIGATLQGNYEVGAKALKKAEPFEKIGVLCNKNGHPSIIEYYELSDEMALQTDENGERLYNFGVILNYLFNVDMLYRIKDSKLPIHIVKKKVEHIDDSGNKVIPNEPNAYKFEYLCVDMIEFSNSCLPYEVDRIKEFAPIKNMTGVDSVESAQAILEKDGYKL